MLEKHRATLLFALGMLCFLAAGLLVRFAPSWQDYSTQPVYPNISATAKKKAPVALKDTTNTATITDEVVRNNAPAKADWFLYVTGSVNKPGVYRLPVASRVFQLVEAAGGFVKDADRVAVNLAAPLADGMHVHVPQVGERASTATAVQNAVPHPQHVTVGPSVRAQGASTAGAVDVNRATADELIAVKGIGPALARRILEYRERHGRFASVDDIAKVSGIGEKRLDAMREYLTVGP